VSVEAELERLDGWIGGLLAGLSPASRNTATRKIASLLRGKQAQRIAAQRNPDGSAFDPRKAPSAKKPSNRALKFLYPSGGAGEPRLVLLKSWVKQGPIFTGFDIEAEAIRSFEKSKIVRWLKATPEEQNKGSRPLRTRATIKQRVMFRKLRRYALLKSGSSANEAWVGFTGRAAEIAEVHQKGGFDRASRKGPRVRYAQRQLLGLTVGEESEILEMLVRMLDKD
jgi:phage virion morphogenesis protein